MTFLTLDLQTKKWLLAFLVCLFCWWLFSAQATCSASSGQGTYIITEAELQALETRLDKLSQLSVTQQRESERLRDTLETSRQELTALQSQLTISTAQLQQAQESLVNANRLLKEYAQEEKRTRLRIKAQRNLWIGLAVTAALVAVCR